jgi:hypothetical protein
MILSSDRYTTPNKILFGFIEPTNKKNEYIEVD